MLMILSNEALLDLAKLCVLPMGHSDSAGVGPVDTLKRIARAWYYA